MPGNLLNKSVTSGGNKVMSSTGSLNRSGGDRPVNKARAVAKPGPDVNSVGQGRPVNKL